MKAKDVLIDRLSGPRTHICWTPDAKPVEERELVVLVRAKDLNGLERTAYQAVQKLNRIHKESET